ALQAYALLSLPWQPDRLARALLCTRVSGRLDRRTLAWHGRQLRLLLDVGHNPQAAEYLAGCLAARAIKGRRLAVFGLLADKDLAGVLEPLRLEVDDWVVAPLNCPRSRPVAELETALRDLGEPVRACSNIAEALLVQCAVAREDDEILVFGSFYCVAEALAWLGQQAEAGNGGAG